MERKIKIQVALPFLLIVVSLFTLKIIKFKPVLTPAEMRMLNFVSEKIDVSERQPFTVYKDMRSPIGIVKLTPEGYPSIPLSKVAPQIQTEGAPLSELKVSMIIFNKNTRMAIVNGTVVKEGDGIGSTKVIKIEKNRLLVETIAPSLGEKRKETRWVYLEGNK